MDQRTCNIDGCTRPTRSPRADWCNTHYFRWYRNGDPNRLLMAERPVTCTSDGCDKPRTRRLYCRMHEERVRRHGDPDANRQRQRGTTATYRSAHTWVAKDRGKAAGYDCAHCDGQAKQWAYDHGDPAELLSSEGYPYSLDTSRYIPLCLPCHVAFDQRRISAVTS